MAVPSAPVGQTPQIIHHGQVPFDINKPPVIDGFKALPRHIDESFKEKFIRKTKANPFVPIGCLGTAAALTYGLRAFKQGQNRQSQLLMRTRIVAQGFTVFAIIIGMATAALKSNP